MRCGAMRSRRDIGSRVHRRELNKFQLKGTEEKKKNKNPRAPVVPSQKVFGVG